MRLRHLVVLVAGLGLGVGSVAIAAQRPRWIARRRVGGIRRGAPGRRLGAAGAAARSPGRAGPRAASGRSSRAAGCAWFLVEFNNPGVGSPLLFTVGLLTYAACPAVVAHAALAYPSGRVAGRLERAVLALAYLSTLVGARAASGARVRPCRAGMHGVPAQPPRASRATPTSSRRSTRVGLRRSAWSGHPRSPRSLCGGSCARRPPRGSSPRPCCCRSSRTSDSSPSATGTALERGYLSNDSVDRRLWLGQAAALGALVLGVCLAWVRGWRARTSVARLVIELSEAPAPGALRDALARALGDPSLALAYPVGPGRHVDAHGPPGRAVRARRACGDAARAGRPAGRRSSSTEPNCATTRGCSRTSAPPRASRSTMSACRPRRARSSSSCGRRAPGPIEAGDAERQRLERDLHDGAQQRLVVLSFALRLLRGRARRRPSRARRRGRTRTPRRARRAARARKRDLPRRARGRGARDRARGARRDRPGADRDRALPDERLAPAVEAAAYFLVAEVVKRGARRAGRGARRPSRTDGCTVEIDSAGDLDGDLVDLEDRIGALDGELTVEPTRRPTRRFARRSHAA